MIMRNDYEADRPLQERSRLDSDLVEASTTSDSAPPTGAGSISSNPWPSLAA